MANNVILGDEAVALGAVDAGVSAVYGYPGTPSTEIIEYLLKYTEKHGAPYAAWCANEKTAMETALGTSMVGRRAMVTMKHVGLNVAADAFVNAGLLEINGGLVLAVADDPGMHSSQNEQDSRYYADFANIICLEPVNQQEAYEMTREAFDLSEKFHIPVMIRLVTRLAHSRARVVTSQGREQNALSKAADPRGWMLLPATARVRWANLLEKQKAFNEYTEGTDHNPLKINPDFNDFGVITSGLGRNYYVENLEDLGTSPSHLHIGAYPLPVSKIRALAEKVDRLVLLEEGDPVIETKLRGILPQNMVIAGKLDGAVPRTGELNPDNVRTVLGLAPRESAATASVLPGRPPQLCKGCPHADTYMAIKEACSRYDRSLVTSDIGCYALGALPPYQVPESIVCMGASVGMAKGAAEAGFGPVLAVIGDSTFLHSGVTGLLDVVAGQANVTIVIVDNETVAMTGGQTTILPSSRLSALILGTGIPKEHLRIIEPLKKNHDANVAVFVEEMEYQGPSVIIAVRECIETLRKRNRKQGNK